jgi:predicted nuclease of predicted toxin-antitoxin system
VTRPSGARRGFLLDEDLPPAAARIARGLGIEAHSVHELGRTGHGDEDQLDFATSRQWIMVTRNRDDYIELTTRAFATNRPHHGVLLVGRRTPNTDPEGIAHSLAAWARCSSSRMSGPPPPPAWRPGGPASIRLPGVGKHDHPSRG